MRASTRFARRYPGGQRLPWALALCCLIPLLSACLPAPESQSDYAPRDDTERIQELFSTGSSDEWVEAEGQVERMLSDDREGSRHQRFVVRLATGQTLLISHNIDLAERVPVRVGQTVAFRGEYEWNDRGGVVHWTHHDPEGRHEGGWIRHAGRTYR